MNLNEIQLFAAIDAGTLDELAARLKPLAFKAGEPVLWENDPGRDLYLIQAGTVRVSVVSDNGEVVWLRNMGPGECFGELSLLDGGARSADVTAETECQLSQLSREDFFDFAAQHPEVSKAVIELLAGRVRDLTSVIERAGLLEPQKQQAHDSGRA